MKPVIFLLLSLLALTPLYSQFTDNFSDGDFSSNPQWIGDTSRFIVNANGELQLQDRTPVANNTSYLSVAAATSINDETTWEFYVRLQFATSTTNFARVYLMASQPDLAGNLNGYFLRIGGITGNDDALELFRQDGNRNTLILSGRAGGVGEDPALARVRIIRSTEGEWTLFADYNGGTDYALEGSAVDATHASGNYFGFYCRYTSTRSELFFFDDVFINPLFVDNTPPTLLSTEVLSATSIELTFDEPLDAASVQNLSNYTINQGIGNPAEAILVAPTIVFVEWATPLQSSIFYTLTVSGIRDLSGNAMPIQTEEIVFFDVQLAQPGDLVINELLYQPNTGGSRFVELYNKSDKIINIIGLDIINTQRTTGNVSQRIQRDFLLLPDAYVAITDSPADIVQRYNTPEPGNIVQNNVPVFETGSGNVTIRRGNLTIDSFDYRDDLHFSLLRSRRGVSLERLDPSAPTQNPGNWHSAASTAGFATPGYQNSQFFAGSGRIDQVIGLANKTFSPDGDGFEDVLIIEYNADQPGLTANIRIFDANGRLVKRLVDNEMLAARGNFKWDGANDEGAKARIGIYVVWIELFTPGGRVERKRATCVLAGKLN
ncbi:MAG TPA: lamin tail domain-containing protein [Saprospiraceae bacterium]|nr:lamin tail domain-containing protein [Saprospiraceae bacterium]HMP25558.1 lamin tail domain-containing protein [Saprospiraceae bacterium]